MKTPLDNHKPDIFLPLTDSNNSKLLPAFNRQTTSSKHRAFKQHAWHSQAGVQPSEICYSNVQNLNVINMNVSHHDKMRPQSNIRLIQSFWRKMGITAQPQQPASHFKEHIHPPKHYGYAGKGFPIPWIALNVVEAKCSSTISLYGHTDLLEQSTNMQITHRSQRRSPRSDSYWRMF